ncbi:MAG: heme-binding protein, partial [Phycisphaerales bacterium]
MSADSGGLPLYRNGECIGGIGVETGIVAPGTALPAATGLARYQVDTIKPSGAPSTEELIALAGQSGTIAPNTNFAPTNSNITADKILAGGVRFAYAYAPPPATTLPPALVPANLQFIFPAATPFLDAPATSFFTTATLPNPNTFPATNLTLPNRTGVATSGASVAAFVPGGEGTAFTGVAGAAFGGQNLTAPEVATILSQAHATNNVLRAMIRRDVPQLSRVTVSVVDTNGTLLGVYRSEDAPVFGFDVSLQKARSVAFFSRAEAAAILGTHVAPTLTAVGYVPVAAPLLYGKYVAAAAARGAPLNGTMVYGNRTIGALGRPNFPDGLDGTPAGPYSALGTVGTTGVGAQNQVFSVFNTGIQTELMLNNLAAFLVTFGSTPGGVPGAGETAAFTTFNTNRGVRSTVGATPGTLETAPLVGVPARSTVGEPDVLAAAGGLPGRTLANGLQIFAGGVPLYKGGQLVGAVGVSGDGIEQDDNIAFDGTRGFRTFPAGTRTADNFVLPINQRLPFVKFPRAPFKGNGIGG